MAVAQCDSGLPLWQLESVAGWDAQSATSFLRRTKSCLSTAPPFGRRGFPFTPARLWEGASAELSRRSFSESHAFPATVEGAACTPVLIVNSFNPRKPRPRSPFGELEVFEVVAQGIS